MNVPLRDPGTGNRRPGPDKRMFYVGFAIGLLIVGPLWWWLLW